MGLSLALSNALSGMRSGHSSLDVLSRNVANAGTPGYHRQSVNVVDANGINSTYARTGQVSRAFNQSLQDHYTRATSQSGFTSVRANFIDRLQTIIGKPGQGGSLDTVFADFQAAMAGLSASPDNYAVRSTAVGAAQSLAQTLNGLSSEVQSLRRETEARIGTTVDSLNHNLATLEKINNQVADHGLSASARSTLMDQRDRIVAEVASVIDLRVEYKNDGTVALMTRTGVGLLDGTASTFEFQPSGPLSATSLFNVDTAQSGVGQLTIRTPSGLRLDAVQQNVVKSGELAGLIELRDRTLVQAQGQLDDVAAALAQSMSTVTTAGTATTSGAAAGFGVDIGAIRNGNDFVLNYTQGGNPKQLRVVRVDDPGKLPLDTTDAQGNRVVGLDFSGGAGSVAAQLQAILGSGLAVSNPAGSQLQILDDGLAGTTDVSGLVAHATVTGTQGAGLALSLFVDAGNADFTNALDGPGQKLGFAARISVNSAVVDDARLMVQFTAGGSLGDDDRADYLLEQLDTMQFATFNASGRPMDYRFSGSVGDLINQTINFQGNVAEQALSDDDTQQLTMEAINQQLDSEYGIDVDEEMARLMELQNAYAANARVMSTIQELLNQLMNI